MSQTADRTKTAGTPESQGDYPDFPGSEKTYLDMGDGIRVPARKITLSDGEPPLFVYDTSGPQGHDVRQGSRRCGGEWIRGRGDVEEIAPAYQGPQLAGMPEGPCAGRKVLRGRGPRDADALRPAGHRHAGDAIRRRPRERRPRVRAVARSPGAGRSSRPTSTTRRASR